MLTYLLVQRAALCRAHPEVWIGWKSKSLSVNLSRVLLAGAWVDGGGFKALGGRDEDVHLQSLLLFE